MTTSIISKYMKNILDEYFSENIYLDTISLLKNDEELHNILSTIIIENLSKKEKNYILNNMNKPLDDKTQQKLDIFFNISKKPNNTKYTMSEFYGSNKRKLHDDNNQNDYKKLKTSEDINQHTDKDTNKDTNKDIISKVDKQTIESLLNNLKISSNY